MGAALTDVLLPRRLVQRDVLADEDADPYSAEVEAVQKLVDLRQLVQAHLRQGSQGLGPSPRRRMRGRGLGPSHWRRNARQGFRV